MARTPWVENDVRENCQDTSVTLVGATPWTNVDLRPRRGLMSWWYTLALLCLDYVVGWLTYIVGLVLLNLVTRNYFNSWDNFPANIRHAFWFPIGIVLGMALTSGYRLSQRSPTQSTFADLQQYVVGCVVGGFLAMTASYVAKHFGGVDIQAPTQVIVATLVSPFLIGFGHAVLRQIVMRRIPVRVAVVDDGSTWQRIATHLHLQRGIELVGLIASDDAHAALLSLGSLDEIEDIVKKHRIDRVIFGAVNQHGADFASRYRAATELVDTAFVPSLFELISWRSRLTDLSGLPLLEMAPRHVSLYDRFTKRAFDLIVASALLLLFLPVMVLTALAIKLTSRGPILFRQERLGQHREPFTILKFRTMVRGAAEVRSTSTHSDGQPLFVARGKLDESNRVTKVGAALRRTGIDEIPQFFNVLTGSMSVVGPRPFVRHESDISDEHYAQRFAVRPGITGLWQVSGRNNLTAEELQQLDYLYVAAWSISWDVKICFDTPRAMMRGLGAY